MYVNVVLRLNGVLPRQFPWELVFLCSYKEQIAQIQSCSLKNGLSCAVVVPAFFIQHSQLTSIPMFGNGWQ